MATMSNVLFSWADVETLPELRRLELVLDTLPDGELLDTLDRERGRGRNDYPVRAMWRALVAGVVFGHRSIASLLRELGRNPALLSMCGFDPLPRQSRPRRVLRGSRVEYLPSPRHDSIPSHWNFSRFVSQVVRHEPLVRAMVEGLCDELLEVLPDFGKHLGYDGKAIASHSTGRENRRTGHRSDRDADWGRHETQGRRLGEGQHVVRLSAASGRRYPLRAPGVVPGDAGLAFGGQRARGDGRRGVRRLAGAGSSVQ